MNPIYLVIADMVQFGVWTIDDVPTEALVDVKAILDERGIVY